MSYITYIMAVPEPCVQCIVMTRDIGNMGRRQCQTLKRMTSVRHQSEMLVKAPVDGKNNGGSGE